MLLVVLMIEVEQPEALSARKLVLETAKHNVLTAYNGKSGIEMFRRFPHVDIVVLHMDVQDQPFEDAVRKLREIRADVPIIALSPAGAVTMPNVDYTISSHEPQALLNILAKHYHASTTN